MLYITVFIGIIIFFALFLTSFLLRSMKENDEQRITILLEEIHHERQESVTNGNFNSLKNNQQVIRKKLVQIRLELSQTEEDLKEVIPQLLN